MMRNEPIPSTNLAAELRRVFDEAFAREPAVAAPREDFLAIDVAGQAFAVRLAEIAGLVSNRRILALPSPRREFLGVAGLRGSVIPVYSLRSLLGHPPSEDLRLLLLAGTTNLVGLAFDRYDGHLQLGKGDLAPPDPTAPPGYVREVAHTVEGTRAVLSIPSLLEAIRQAARVG